MGNDRYNEISLLDVSRDFPVDTETFVEYYTGRFESDLHMFFDVTQNFGDGSYPFVLEMPCRVTNLRRRHMVWDHLNHYYMFSAAVFYMSMCTQIVGRLYGYHQMENFMRASGWPMLCCGMGGLMHPIQVMMESKLYPLHPNDSYVWTLRNAGKYLKEEFLKMVEDLNVMDPSELFDQQEFLYRTWIRNRETEYESYFVAYPVDHMPKLHVHEFLREYKEEVPQWLVDYKPGDQISFSDFMNCRVGYYPGAGYDGNLVRVCNKSHSVHCFLHADYGISREEMESHLAEERCLSGYHVIGKVDWSDTVCFESNRWFCPELEPYCFMAVFERDADRDESWGAERLAMTFLLADGIKTYDELFVKQYQKAPWIMLLQDHGFGGNYDRFDRGGKLSSIVSRGVKPQFVLCDEGTRMWKGYYKMDRILPTHHGLRVSDRYLWTLDYANMFYSAY
jgi:hypothetical protein